MSNMLLSPVHSIQRRLAAVKADTPFGMAYQLLLPGYLVSIAGLLMTSTAMNSTCTVGDGLGDMFNKMLMSTRACVYAGVHPCADDANKRACGRLRQRLRPSLGGTAARLHHELRGGRHCG